MLLSVLVVSRTEALLSSMLSTLKDAVHLPHEEVEILCPGMAKKKKRDTLKTTRTTSFCGEPSSISLRQQYEFG